MIITLNSLHTFKMKSIVFREIKTPSYFSKGEMLSGMDEKSNGLTLHFSTLHTVTGCDSVTTNVTLLCNRDQTSDISLVDNSDNCR